MARFRKASAIARPILALVACAIAWSCAGFLGIDDDYDDGAGGGKASGGMSSGGSSAAGGAGANSGGALAGFAGTGLTSSGGSSFDSGQDTSTDSSSSGEQCLNGIDDDGDQLVDCADPDCKGAGYQCSPNPPAGWSGPFAFYDGPSAPACPSSFSNEFANGGIGFLGPPAACSKCTCSTTHCRAFVSRHSDSACSKSPPSAPKAGLASTAIGQTTAAPFKA